MRAFLFIELRGRLITNIASNDRQAVVRGIKLYINVSRAPVEATIRRAACDVRENGGY